MKTLVSCLVALVQFRGAFVLAQIVKNEGVGGLYKGFWPNFARIGSWNIVVRVLSCSLLLATRLWPVCSSSFLFCFSQQMFLTYEQLKKKFATL